MVRDNERLPVLIIYTGGTIGMMPTENGYMPNPKAFPEMLDKIKTLNAERERLGLDFYIEVDGGVGEGVKGAADYDHVGDVVKLLKKVSYKKGDGKEQYLL